MKKKKSKKKKRDKATSIDVTISLGFKSHKEQVFIFSVFSVEDFF